MLNSIMKLNGLILLQILISRLLTNDIVVGALKPIVSDDFIVQQPLNKQPSSKKYERTTDRCWTINNVYINIDFCSV